MVEKNITIFSAREYEYQDKEGLKVYFYFNEKDNDNIVGLQVKAVDYKKRELMQELKDHDLENKKFIPATAKYGFDYFTEKLELIEIVLN